MAGFCIEVRSGGDVRQKFRIVDLGQCAASGSFQHGNAGAAWVHPEQSRHWWVRRTAAELLLIEGAPDRLPQESESLLEWLPGRWGSFRGFEISFDPQQIAVFVDPACSRPIFYRASPDDLLIADKLSTIALNSSYPCQLNWDGVLEAMLLGSAYRYHLTSLAGVEEVAPGTALVFRENKVVSRYSNQMPEDESLPPDMIRKDPQGTVARALEKSVRECWPDGKAALMLSGGLDSRAILALAGDGRRAVTLEMSARETEIAKQIAEACRAEFIALPFPADEWLHRAQEGYWIAAATRDIEFVNDIGLNGRLAPYDVHGIAHGYLFDTILKGWLIRPLHRHVDLSNTVLGQMGPAGVHFRDTTSRASFNADKDVLGMLSKDGSQRAITQLRGTAESLTPVRDGRFDITFERHILGWVSKQVHYGCYLSWIEALDLSSPIFHPALWSWYRHTGAEDRYLGRAYRRTLAAMQHPAFAVPDANTGAPISIPKERWTDTAQDRLWYRTARKIWRGLHKDRSVPYTDKRAARFRTPEGRQLLESGIETLRENPLFDREALERAFQDFFNGNDRPFEPLLTVTGVAQWQTLVKSGRESSAPQIRDVQVEPPVAG